MNCRKRLPFAREDGIGIVGAIFFLLLMAVLGVAFVSFGTTQQATAATDVMQTRAYLAARSGIEWALYNWSISKDAGQCNNQSGTFSFPAPTLHSFTVTVSCANHAVGGSDLTRITATACTHPHNGTCPGASTPPPDYVERVIYVDVPPEPAGP